MISNGLRVGIIGCGLIGEKRAAALGDDHLVASYDLDPTRAERLVSRNGGKAVQSVEELFACSPDVVVVATEHGHLARLSVAALDAGCHVLVEKPAGIGTVDVDAIAAAQRRAARLVKVGFNHRFHPGIGRAISEARSGSFGEVLWLRGRYGHGGRLGYEREWRADPIRSGGGEIVDQGMHLLDLSYWLLGDLPLCASMLRTQFWEAPVDDNAVLLLGEAGGVGCSAAFSLLHVSWTEWKNTFSLEIACRTAKFAVDGLSHSYGPQRLRIYRMRPELGPPELEEITYPDEDRSWELEWQQLREAIASFPSQRGLDGDLASARYAWRVVEQAQSS